jgi:ATP-dependent protease HslVU (ClpYQ) ATPase subunit
MERFYQDFQVPPGGDIASGMVNVLREILPKMGVVTGGGLTSRHKMNVAQCRPKFEEQEIEKLLGQEKILKAAIEAVEQDGIGNSYLLSSSLLHLFTS